MFDEFIGFVRQLYNSDQFIPLHEPKFVGNEKEYLLDCIDSTFVSSVGAYVDKFEREIARYTGSPYAIATVNGTAALHLALKLAGVGSGDLVITQPLSFIATSNAISYCGAQPVFVDVDRATLGLSAVALAEFIKNETHCDASGTIRYNKSKARITACVPMHTFGHPCKIDDIASICGENGIELIEDAAESIGSTFRGKHTGTFGRLAILSFNGNKVITTGGGGMLLTSDESLAKKAKHLSTQAKVPHPWAYEHDYVGYNYRLPNLNAALGCAQLEQLPDFITSKRALADAYAEFFSGTDITFVREPNGANSNYWLNTVILPDKSVRDSFLEITNKNGVMTRPAWNLLNTLHMYRDCPTAELTNARWLADRLVNIPSSAILK